MEIRNGVYYPDAGNILKRDNSYMFSSKSASVTEEVIDDSQVRLVSSGLLLDKYLLKLDTSNLDRKTLKIALVELKYSNDDQIAIILNKEDSAEDRERFDKMQAWRNWASKIINNVIL